MINGIKRKIIALVLSVSVAAGGVTAVVMNYKGGEFRPDAYANSRERNDNQIVFPGQDMSALGEETSDESELWEQDKNAEEKLKPEDKPSDSLLFETTKVAAANNTMQGIENTDAPAQEENGSVDTVYIPDVDPGQNADGTQGRKDNVILIPSDADGTTSGGHGSKVDQSQNETSTGNTDSSNGNGSGDSQENGSTGDNNGGNTSGGTDTPPTPAPVDPDPTEPTLPEDPWSMVDKYPEQGLTGVTEEEYKKFSLNITSAPPSSDNFYMGEWLNDKRVLCGVMVYLCIDGEEAYQLTDLNENFKILSYPEQITERTITLKFAYRLSPEYEWIEGTYNAPVNYNGKVIVRNFSSEDTPYLDVFLVDDADKYISLARYKNNAMFTWEAEHGVEEGQYIFPGFSDTQNGEVLPDFYDVTGMTGAREFYPLTPVALPEGNTMEWTWQTVRFSALGDPYTHLQTLTSCKSGDSVEIPEGIQALMLSSENGAIPEFKDMYVPASMLQLFDWEQNIVSYNVTNSYTVDADNMIYASYEGMLLDKDMTEIYDIPDSKEKVTVPKTVSEIDFSEENVISEIHFLSETPGSFDFSNLQNAKIYVPSDRYMKYLTAWGKHPGNAGNVLLAEDEGNEEFVEDDTCIYSLDGKTLLAVKGDVRGTLIVKEGVEIIAENALEGCGLIDRMILPGTISKLESGSLSVNAPERIVFLGTDAPEIYADTFADTTKLQVLKSAQENYISAWSSVLGERTNQIHFKEYQMVEGGEEGFTYLSEGACEQADEPAGAVLLMAPAGLSSFNAGSKSDVTWKEIASGAFAGNQALFMVEVPDTVTYIGLDAFNGCGSLQGVISDAKDEITIREGAFDNDPELRFIALNAAKKLDMYEYVDTAFVYGVPGCDGGEYGESYVSWICPSYYIRENAGGILLYGADEDDRYLLRATGNVTGDITLEANTIEIVMYAFVGCDQLTGIVDWGSLIAIGDYSFMKTGVKQVTITNPSFHYIGYYAFENCVNLTSVDIEEASGCQISNYAFLGCASLCSVNFGEDAGIYGIGEEAFAETTLTEFTIPASVQTLYPLIFASCENLKRVTFLGNVPPQLVVWYGGEYYFIDESSDVGLLHVPEGMEQTYIEEWNYSILGYYEGDASWLPEATIIKARNRIRTLLGMSEDSMEEVPEEPEEPELPEWPDFFQTEDGTPVETSDGAENSEQSDTETTTGQNDSKDSDNSNDMKETLATDSDAEAK